MSLPAYNPASDDLPLSDDELAQLDHLLSTLPGDAVMNIEALDGYLAALLLSPVPLESLAGDDWMPMIWGGEDADTVFASGKQRKRLQLLVLRQAQATALQWQRKPEIWEPLFTLAEEGEQQWVDAEDWCIGFMIGVDVHAEAWSPLFETPDSKAALAPMLLLGGDEEQLDADDLSRLDDVEERDAISREVHAGVLQLLKLRKPAVGA